MKGRKVQYKEISIVDACVEDLPDILALQYRAFQSEAKLLGNYAIPPLKETLADTVEQFRKGTILKALDASGRLVGSVRGRSEDGTIHVGKLMVDPECQGRGIGGQLLCAIESRLPAARYELFTSDKSSQNVRLYEKFGYREFTRKNLPDGLTLVFLEKCENSAKEPGKNTI